MCLAGGRYSRRKADRCSRESGGSCCCKSGEGSWTSQLPQSSPPQILVCSIYTNAQGKKKREGRMRNKSDKACFLSIQKKQKKNRFDYNETKGKGRSKIKLAGLQGEVYSANQRLWLAPVIAYFSMTQNTTDLSSDLLSARVCVCVLSCPQLAGRSL